MFKRFLALPCAAACLAAVSVGSALADEATTVGGRMYADLTSIDQKNGDAKTAASGFGIDVKRFYVIVDHKFDDMWSANVTTDFNYTGKTTETQETQVFIKKAYVQAKLSDALVGRLGSTDLPWVPFVESFYGYRFVENLIVDRLKFGTTTDWGVNANGKLGGMANYSVSLVNGNGYKNPSRSKQMDVEARVGFTPIEGLTFGLGGYSGKLGKKVEGVATFHTAERFDAMAAYVKSGLRLGAEYFTADNWNNVTSPLKDKADGFSVWASYDFNPQWGVFARGDSAKVSKDLNPNLKDEYFNVGLVSHPRKNLDFALAYKHEKAKGGFIASSNGNNGIGVAGQGGVGVGTTEGKYDEIGVWAQLGF